MFLRNNFNVLFVILPGLCLEQYKLRSLWNFLKKSCCSVGMQLQMSELSNLLPSACVGPLLDMEKPDRGGKFQREQEHCVLMTQPISVIRFNLMVEVWWTPPPLTPPPHVSAVLQHIKSRLTLIICSGSLNQAHSALWLVCEPDPDSSGSYMSVDAGLIEFLIETDSQTVRVPLQSEPSQRSSRLLRPAHSQLLQGTSWSLKNTLWFSTLIRIQSAEQI